MGLRQWAGKHLISFGIRVHSTKLEAHTKHEINETLNIPEDAMVEADETPEQWQPEQHGNVVIAEPDLMVKYRRGKL